MAEEFTPLTLAEFEAMFDLLFTAHDANNNGVLEESEARALMNTINSKRPDHAEFDEAKFNEVFSKHAVDGKLEKATAHQLALARGQALGFIQTA